MHSKKREKTNDGQEEQGKNKKTLLTESTLKRVEIRGF